jgi:hypothetical protein
MAYTLRSLAKSEPTIGVDFPSKPDYRPTFSLDEKDLPELKSWKVGEKYMLEMEVEMVSASKNEFGRSVHQARFKITKIGVEEEDPGKKGRR